VKILEKVKKIHKMMIVSIKNEDGKYNMLYNIAMRFSKRKKFCMMSATEIARDKVSRICACLIIEYCRKGGRDV
jgi:hypothetical protein